MFSGCPSVCAYVSVPVCVRAFAPKHFLSTSSCFLFSLPIYVSLSASVASKDCHFGHWRRRRSSIPRSRSPFPCRHLIMK